MSGWAKRLESATNIAVLCAFLLVAALAVKRLREPSQSVPHQPTVGERVSVRGVDWSKSGKNLILALSTQCHFCSESAGFYQRLVPSALSSGVQVIAILPQPVSDSSSYLQKLGVKVPEILQSPLDSVEVSGTPTLLVVDRHGRIQKAWVGKLGPDLEDQVVASLR
jgi:hypothetical protein